LLGLVGTENLAAKQMVRIDDRSRYWLSVRRWLEKRSAELLPVSYYLVVFTLPHVLAPLALQNKALVYGLLFRTAAETLLQIAADPKHLGAEIGFLAVLHTWGRKLLAHPHVHCVVPGGGLSPDHRRWIPCGHKFFLPVEVLSVVFRGKFLAAFQRAFQKHKLTLAGGYGTIFKITTTGTLTTLHSFDLTDGAGPEGLVQASDGNFYGTTNSGGFSSSNCSNGNVSGTCGTVFKMTPTGALTTLHIFSYTDRGNPGAAPIQASDGNFYVTTSDGGTTGSGAIFKITPTGTLTTVHNLDPKNGDGAFSVGLVQHSNGIFYGPTVRGGNMSYHFCTVWCGTLFSLSVP